MAFALPCVSLASYPAGAGASRDAGLASAWSDAMHTLGMLAITDHGVSDATIATLHSCALAFFRQPLDAKMAACVHSGYGSGGYVPQGVEAVARSTGDSRAPADAVESFVFNHGGDQRGDQRDQDQHRTRTNPAEARLRDAVRDYWRQLEQLLGLLMQLSAEALGYDGRFFEEYFDPPKCNLRLAYYAPPPAGAIEDVDSEQNSQAPKIERSNRSPQQRYGAHTDYTGFTILRADAPGLQVQLSDGTWVSVSCPPNSLIVNAGDLIERWTNDLWRSPPHRVVFSPVERLSLVFFTGPKSSTKIEALPGTATAERPSRYEPTTAGEHLYMKLKKSNV